MDEELRLLQRNDEERWRYAAQRAGMPIPFKVGDTISIGPSFDFRGNVYSDKWGGVPCPVTAIIVEITDWKTPRPDSKKILATLPPPFRFCPCPVAYDRIKILLK